MRDADLLEKEALRLAREAQYATAIAAEERVLRIRERILGPQHWTVAHTLITLGELNRMTGDYGRSEPLLLRAVEISERLGEQHPLLATALLSLGSLYWQKGDYDRAEVLMQRSLTVREKALGAQDAAVGESLNGLAAAVAGKGDYARAAPLYQRALAIREKALGGQHPDVAETLNNLGELYRVTGDYERAAPLLLRALAVWEHALGPHPKVTFALNNLALIAQAQGDDRRAEGLLRQSLAIRERTLGPQHPLVAIALANLATVLRDQGAYAQSEILAQRAVAILDATLGPRHPETAKAVEILGGVYWRRGDYTQARPLYERAIDIVEQAFGPGHPDLATMLTSLATLQWAQGDRASAVREQAKVNAIRDDTLRLMLAVGSEEQKAAFFRTLDRETSFTIALQVASGPEDKGAARAACELILHRKGRVLEVMAESLAIARRRMTRADEQLLERWVLTRSALARLVVQGPGAMHPAEYRSNVATLTREGEALEGQLSLRSPEMRDQFRSVTIQQVQEALPPEGVLVEFVAYRPYKGPARRSEEFWGPWRYVAYVLPKVGELAWVELGDAATIERDIEAFRAALARPAGPDVRGVARTLDERLMRPVRALLGKSRFVFLAPDGALNLVPFGALVDERDRYLIEDFSFTYLGSGRDLLRSKNRSAPRQDPLLIADPDFEETGRPGRQTSSRRSIDFGDAGFRPLPGTALEAVALKRVVPEFTVLTRSAATEGALKRVHGPRILHIATHGFFLPDQERTAAVRTSGPLEGSGTLGPTGVLEENPLLRAGLALSGANRRESRDEDGVVTALEVAGLDLLGTQLVVLSACDTGLGSIRTGNGVYGLRRALVMAGAESQIVSLWKVEDGATKDLMVAFYGFLAQGEGRGEALRRAQLGMLGGGDRGNPFFWASFIQVGDWTPLHHKTSARSSQWSVGAR